MDVFFRYWRRLPPVFREAVWYGIIGGSSFVLDFCLYLFLTRALDVYFLLANVLSFFIVGTCNFFANRHWTFGHRGKVRFRDYTKFFVIAGSGVVWNTAILGTLVHAFEFHDVLAKSIAAGIVFFWNFGMNRWWTFRHKKAPPMALPL